MLDENDVYDRRIIHDFPKMPTSMRSAFNASNIICRVGNLISWVLMAACLLIVMTFFYRVAFIPAPPLIIEYSLPSLALLTIILAVITRWIIPFLFSALVRIWYYTTRSNWQKK